MSKAYQVQFVLPVNNPEDNVVRTRKRGVIHFEVPINHPDINNLGIQKLLEVAHDTEKLTLLTPLNNKTGLSKSKKSSKASEQPETEPS